MTLFQGRLINHVHLRVRDLVQSEKFFRAIFGSLGMASAFGEDDERFRIDELYIDQADDCVSCVHLAFQAPSHEAVRRFHEAGLANGGTDNGAPGKRSYHSHYNAAFLKDPGGNNIEAICEEPTRRSAKAVLVERLDDIRETAGRLLATPGDAVCATGFPGLIFGSAASATNGK